MKRSILGISKTIPIALIISLSIILLTLTFAILPVYAAWYTINSNPSFTTSTDWEVDTWMQGSGSHSYNLGSGTAYTYLTISGYQDWGNTEYEQGTDPWYSYGTELPYVVPLSVAQRLLTYSKRTTYSYNWFYGRVNKYFEIWATNGEEWAEIMVVFDSQGLFMPAEASQNNYWAREHPGGWYFVGYRHWNMGSGWTYRETNLNSIFNLLSSEFGLDLSEWYVSCLCFGVEGTSGSMGATWDYVQWDIGM